MNLHDTTDATIWTKEWLQTIKANPGIPTDEGAMIGWFANAIMAGYDAGRKAGEELTIDDGENHTRPVRTGETSRQMAVPMDRVKYTGNLATDNLLDFMAEDLERMRRAGVVACRLCGALFRFTPGNLGAGLDLLGQHSELHEKVSEGE